LPFKEAVDASMPCAFIKLKSVMEDVLLTPSFLILALKTPVDSNCCITHDFADGLTIKTTSNNIIKNVNEFFRSHVFIFCKSILFKFLDVLGEC
jgi:hypothetical protein